MMMKRITTASNEWVIRFSPLKNAQIHEVERAQQHEKGDDVLDELVDRADGYRAEDRHIHRLGAQNPHVELGVEATAPEHDGVEKQHHGSRRR